MKFLPKSAAMPVLSRKQCLVLTLAAGAAGWSLGARFSPPSQTLSHPSDAPLSADALLPPDGAADAKFSLAASSEPKSSGLEAEFLELLKLTPKEWPDHLRRAFQQGNQDEIKWLAERWAARDPASLLVFMQSADGLGFSPDYWPDWTVTQACFGAWFGKDMAGALAAMERLTRFDADMGRMSHTVWQVIFPTLMRSNPARALQFLGDHPDFAASPMMSYPEYRNLAPLVVNMPGCAGRKRLLTGIFEAFRNDSDPEKGHRAGLTWLAELDAASRLEAVPDLRDLNGADGAKMRDLLRKAFTTADLDALDRKAGGTPVPGRVRQLAQLRALQDPQAAMTWASALKGWDRLAAMGGILEISAPGNPEQASAFLENIPAGPLRDRALSTVISNLSSTGGLRAAADWLVSLPDARDARTGLGQLAGNWALNQPADCAAWIGTLPAGPLRLKVASEALNGVRDDTGKLAMAASLPVDLGIDALNHSWAEMTKSDSRPLAEAAARQPPGPIREAAMAKASKDARVLFNGFTQSWLDWANALPTPADRAAALRGAEERGGSSRWDEGIREKARQQLSGGGL